MNDHELYLQWCRAKIDGLSRKEFASAMGMSKKVLDNKLYRGSQGARNKIVDKVEGNYRTITAHGVRHRSVEDLLKHLNVDMTVWRMDDRHEIGSWEMGRRAEEADLTWKGGRIDHGHKMDSGKLHIDTLHRFKVPLVRIEPIPIEPVLGNVIIEAQSRRPREDQLIEIGRVLVVPDMQIGFRRDIATGELVPYHDRVAMSVVLNVARMNDFDEVVYLGDFADFSEWSDKFTREPEFYWTTQPMIIEAAWFFQQMVNACPLAKHTVIQGNHEKRFEDQMITHLRAAYKLRPATELRLPEPMSIERMFGFEQMGIELSDPYPNGEHWVGNVRFVHGNRVAGNPGATATAMLKDASYSTMFGHVHRIERATKTVDDRQGERRVWAITPGCLCHTDYRVPGHKKGQHWQQGFGVVYYQGPEPVGRSIDIVNGQVAFEGGWYNGVDYKDDLVHDTGWKF